MKVNKHNGAQFGIQKHAEEVAQGPLNRNGAEAPTSSRFEMDASA
jgi:hypothetical protein